MSKVREFLKSSGTRRRIVEDAQAMVDFSDVPTFLLCQSIELMISELNARNYRIYDFDNKDKAVYGLKIIGGRAYFLTEEGK